LYLVFVIIIKLKHYYFTNLSFLKSHGGKRVFLYGLILFFVIIMIAALFFIYNNSRYASEGIRSNGRLDIYKEFLDNLTFKKILFGSNYGDYSSIGLHSTFLTFFAYLGIFSIPIIIMFIFSIINFYQQKLFLLLGVLILYTVYSTIETLSPFFIGDFLLIPLLMQGIMGAFMPSK
jgi:hypothetical protein